MSCRCCLQFPWKQRLTDIHPRLKLVCLLADTFDARLIVFGDNAALPSGVPGDPAKDYSSSARQGDGHCGPFNATGPDAPYAICPAPGSVPESELVRGCCRHFAYCSPYARFGLAQNERYSTVVVAPRLLKLPQDNWRVSGQHAALEKNALLTMKRICGEQHPTLNRFISCRRSSRMSWAMQPTSTSGVLVTGSETMSSHWTPRWSHLERSMQLTTSRFGQTCSQSCSCWPRCASDCVMTPSRRCRHSCEIRANSVAGWGRGRSFGISHIRRYRAE